MNDQPGGDKTGADGLAAAVRRCWADERAPDELRRRVADLIAADRASARRTSLFRRYGPMGLAAAAAVVLAGVGGGLFRLAHPLTPVASAGAVTGVLPTALETALIRTHDGCSRRADHQHLPVPRSNGYAIAASLRARLDRPVLVNHPADPAWRFAGASVCPVGSVRSAHLVFRRGDGDTLSVFSLPRSSAPTAADGQQFQVDMDGHPIVGYVGHRAVYCLVASGCPMDVSVSRLADIRRQLQGRVVVADATSSFVPADGELIHGTDR